MNTHRKVGLVVLFNHNYEKNIDLIKKLYKPRFDALKIIMPFYYGNDADVIGVYGNSFTFQTFIAQARPTLEKMDCDDYLIIGDDLILNPEFNCNNIHDKLSIAEGAFYIDAVENVSKCNFNRPLLEASCFSPNYPGLDASANRFVPGYNEAYQILSAKGLVDKTTLHHWKPFFQHFKKGFFKNLKANYKILKGRIWHLLKVLQYKIKPAKLPYPYVFGYSDIILVPKEKLTDWCRYLEVFATWNMFVEMAIPTAIMLLPNTQVCFAPQGKYKTGNVWYPQNPQHFNTISEIINTLISQAENIEDLMRFYPKEYLYLHPVKLSKFSVSVSQ